MSDRNRHESADLEDYEVEDSSDTLDGPPGDDPLDRGVIPPQHWSAAMKSGPEGLEERESPDELLSEEEPDDQYDIDDDEDDEVEPRAGRLVADDEDAEAFGEEELVARDVGVDGGAASAEEAAVHVEDEDA
jgi:Family of unknown function (DUF5709)